MNTSDLPDVHQEETVKQTPRWEKLNRLHRAILRMGLGDRAGLRRQPTSCLAFYRLHAEYFPEVQRDETWERWAVLVQAMALASVGSEPDVSTGLGTALARAQLSEGRLTRLLRATDDSLFTQVLACARFLAAKGQKQNMSGFGDLLLTSNAGHLEKTRRRIASDYYRELNAPKSL